MEKRTLELSKTDLRILEIAMAEFNAASLRRAGSHRTKNDDRWMFEARYEAGIDLCARIAAAIKTFD